MSKRRPTSRASVSLPDRMCEELGAVAKDLGQSRNRLFQTAIHEFLVRRSAAGQPAGFGEEHEAWTAHDGERPRKGTLGKRSSFSLRTDLFKETGVVAKSLGISRSKLIQTVLEEYLQRKRDEAVTVALDRLLEQHPDEVDPIVQHFALETLRRAG